jgi:pimeloyl-ACP methyl ester carboxylesterase
VRVDEHTVTLDHAPVFYRSGSSPRTPVLYLHGAPTSCDDWTPFLERTGGVAPDLPGFGRSGKAGHLDYSPEGHADFIERFLHDLGIDHVRLVAHDWGAAGGLVFAQRHPQRVRRLVLCDALPLLEGFRFSGLPHVWRRKVIGELVMGSINKWLLSRWLRAGSVHADAWPDGRVASVWEQFDQGTQRAILRLHRWADEARLVAAGADLHALDAPALVIWGESDPWLPAELANRYGSRLPHARVERIADAGHWPWLDQPTVVERIVSFLDERS